eukprot:403335232
MQLSAKKQRDLTYLEVQAQLIVNEDEDAPEVNDEDKYEQLLAKKQDRRTGESLYDFLERQVKSQMREALGQPLQNISQDLLNKVVTKEVQKDLKKFKLNAGKTPNKENKNKGALGRSAEKGAFPSPQRRLQFSNNPAQGFGSPDRQGVEDNFYYGNDGNNGGNSKEVREILKELDGGIHDKISLIKMLIIKCSEADSNYKKIKQAINKGEVNSAEKMVSLVEQHNAVTLKDLQNEIQQKTDLLDLVSYLGDQIKRERQELVGSKSVGKSRGDSESQNEIKELKKCVDEQRQRIKDLESNKSNRKDQISKDLMEQLNEADGQILEYKRRLEAMERENSKLREEMRSHIDDYQHQLDNRDNEIRVLNHRLDQGQSNLRDSEIQAMIKKENEAYKSENRLLRDKIGSLNNEIDTLAKQRSVPSSNSKQTQVLENEISHLRQQMIDKEREYQKQLDHMRGLVNDKDQLVSKQKNEWAGIYANMKQEIEDLKGDNRALQIESEKLIKQLEMGAGAQGGNRQLEKELAKKLKKRELECSALWETLKDMHISGRNVFDARQMLDILALRALDTKAKRKLKI